MIYSPHDYQRYAIDYILEHPIAAVFLDLGLGKTSITLTALDQLLFDRFEAHRVLIIAPLRVARDTWPDELKKWDHLRRIQMSVVVGSAEERMICWIQSDCLVQHTITNSARRIKSRNEMPIYRLKLLLSSMRTGKDTA